jgi:hypothetical protein
MQQRHLKEGGVPEEVSDSMRGCGGGGGGGERYKAADIPRKNISPFPYEDFCSKSWNMSPKKT